MTAMPALSRNLRGDVTGGSLGLESEVVGVWYGNRALQCPELPRSRDVAALGGLCKGPRSGHPEREPT